MRFVIELSDAEAAQLEKLAQKRKKTTEQCIRDFIAASNAGTDGWIHPMENAKQNVSKE